jgi:hypothetical protein
MEGSAANIEPGPMEGDDLMPRVFLADGDVRLMPVSLIRSRSFRAVSGRGQ